MNIAKVKRVAKQQFQFLTPLLRKRHTYIRNLKNSEDIFTDIYQSNSWNNKESVSGLGSTLQQTEVIRRELPLLWNQLETRTLLDIPCGDFNWMQYVDLQGLSYIGGDIVAPLVERNNAKFGRAGRSFIVLNVLSDVLPEVDCIFCRDCLVHFSHTDVRTALNNIKASRCRYLLTTTYPGQRRNLPIVTGEWQPLNLQAAPYNFGQPLHIINENSSERSGAYGDKSIALWRVADIP